MNTITKFEPYVNTIIKDLQEKGVYIAIDECSNENYKKLCLYFDVSLPMFFSEYFGPSAYNQLISAIYDKLGTERLYVIKDDLYISSEYKREKKPNITGDEIEYMRIYVTLYIKNIWKNIIMSK